MDLGIHYMNFTLPGGAAALAPTLTATAKAAEAGGAGMFTVMDHWFQMEHFAPATDPMMEGYTTLGFLAGQTSSMKLGLMVTGVTYRHPGLLAKTIATLDVLSGGRAVAGLGAAWYEREHLALGVPYPPRAERFERLEETLQICAQMWSDDDGPYVGRHYRLEETICSPKPLSSPRPTVLIGGSGETKTLRFVARYGDMCNLFAADRDVIAHKLEVLARHCDEVGRDPAEITRTILCGGDLLRDHAAFVDAMADYAAMGVDMVCVSPPAPDPAAWVAQFTAGTAAIHDL